MASATIPVEPPAMAPVHAGRSYRPDIDGLRAIAIIAVVAFHARVPFFRGGFVGVDVFLVISGYLIGSLVYRDVAQSRFSFLHFYERRAKRILPALITLLCACTIIAFFLLSPLELKAYFAQGFATVVSSSNIYYWHLLRYDYFAPTAALQPFLMTWSLGVEEQFYLLFPLALFLLHKFDRRRVFLWVALASGLSLIGCVVCVYLYPSAAFYLLPTRAWELGLGVLIAVYEVQHDGPLALSATAQNVLAWVGLSLILASVLFYSEGTHFPGLAAVLPTAGAAALINARHSFVNRKLLSSRPMVFVGLVSYSWYLWHWPLLSFARIVTGGVISIQCAALIGVVALVVAVFSHRLIEQPFRKSGGRTVRVLAGYATLLAVLGFAFLIGYKAQGWPRRIPQLQTLEATVSEVRSNPCLSGFDESTPHLRPPCVPEGTGPKIAVWGDSHAGALAPAVRRLAAQHGYEFEELAKLTCPPLSTVTRRMTSRPTFARTCAAFNRAALQHLSNDHDTTVVVLAGFWSSPWSEGGKKDGYTNTDQPGEGISDTSSYGNLHDGLLKTITLLRSSGKRVFVVTDVPRYDPDPMTSIRNSIMRVRGKLATLLSPHVFSLDPVAQESLIKPADEIADREVRKAASEGQAQVIDLGQNLCPASRCRFWNNGILLYSDSGHLTPAGARYALGAQDPISDVY